MVSHDAAQSDAKAPMRNSNPPEPMMCFTGVYMYTIFHVVESSIKLSFKVESTNDVNGVW